MNHLLAWINSDRAEEHAATKSAAFAQPVINAEQNLTYFLDSPPSIEHILHICILVMYVSLITHIKHSATS